MDSGERGLQEADRAAPEGWSPLLSHCHAEDADRCLKLSAGGRAVLLCSRCVGLYPALAAGTAARLAGLSLDGGGQLVVGLALPLLGALLWVVEQAGADLGRPTRVGSGALIGLGVGWTLGLHLISPWPPELVRLVVALVTALVAGIAARLIFGGEGREEGRESLELGIDQAGEDEDCPSKE